MKTSAERSNLFNLDRNEMIDQFTQWGGSAYHAELLWRACYQQLQTTFSDLPIRPKLLEQVQHAAPPTLEPVLSQHSQDQLTRKFLLKLADGQTIETVLMRHVAQNGRLRHTVCISTQAGCAMGCVFCATGQMGFMRHLTPGEIVGQILFIRRLLLPEQGEIRNIVLMGMGEPLHNYAAVKTAVSILTDDKGLAIAPRHITLSTVGLPNGIRQMADDHLPIHLAVSLHAATDAERTPLVPINSRWPLADLIAACQYYIAVRKRRIFFEWALIEGKNDSPDQAHAVGSLLAGLDAHVNLIPLNPTPGFEGTPSLPATVSQFQAILADYGLPSTVRQRRGIDIAAGCGQLRTEAERAQP